MSTCLDDPNALTMDELDRLYRRVVYNIRGSFPELIAGTFDVSQLYQQIVPYRTNRRELAFDSNEAYELALMQLLAGLRGYLAGDRDLQQAMRNELASPNPDLTAFRVFATSTVSLAPDALRAMDRHAASSQGSATSATRLSAGEQATLAGRATETVDLKDERPSAGAAPAFGAHAHQPSALERPNVSSLAGTRQPTPPLAPRQAPRQVPYQATPRESTPPLAMPRFATPHLSATNQEPHQPPHQPPHQSQFQPPFQAASGSVAPRMATPNGSAPHVAPPRIPVPTTPSSPIRRDGTMPSLDAHMAVSRAHQATGTAAAGDGSVCRYCSGALPDGRRVTFCPCCGHNLTVQHCPACATELEVEWKFCITCGRGIEAAELRRE